MRLAALIPPALIGFSLFPGSVSAAVTTTTAESVEVSSAASVGLETWLLLFGIALLLFLLSFLRLPVDSAPEFCGLTAFVFFGLCGISLPYVGSTQYLTETVVVGSEITQVVTPVVISDANWLMFAAVILMIFLSLINAWRIVTERAHSATPDSRLRGMREADLMERWR